jgi:hypothetical protein
MTGPKCPILLRPHCPSQDLKGLVRPYQLVGRQGDTGTDEKGYTTNRLAVCSITIIASDIII